MYILLNIGKNGPRKEWALMTTQSKVCTDDIGVKNRLWPLRCPQRKFGILGFNTKYGRGCLLEVVGLRLSCNENCLVLSIIRYSTPLHDAVCCGRQQIVQILVERGANVNELDYKNMTPLKLAVR
jgi:hypothetical protein